MPVVIVWVYLRLQDVVGMMTRTLASMTSHLWLFAQGGRVIAQLFARACFLHLSHYFWFEKQLYVLRSLIIFISRCFQILVIMNLHSHKHISNSPTWFSMAMLRLRRRHSLGNDAWSELWFKKGLHASLVICQSIVCVSAQLHYAAVLLMILTNMTTQLFAVSYIAHVISWLILHSFMFNGLWIHYILFYASVQRCIMWICVELFQ